MRGSREQKVAMHIGASDRYAVELSVSRFVSSSWHVLQQYASDCSHDAKTDACCQTRRMQLQAPNAPCMQTPYSVHACCFDLVQPRWYMITQQLL
jgi:hypothetical protein